jgi:hypothetical protein
LSVGSVGISVGVVRNQVMLTKVASAWNIEAGKSVTEQL